MSRNRDLISIDSYKTEKAIEELSDSLKKVKGGILKSVKRALSKTAAGMKTDVVRMVREEYNVPAKEVRQKVWLHRFLQGDDPYVKLSAQGRMSIPLAQYGPRPRVPVSEGGRRPQKGISVQIKKVSGRKVIDGTFLQKSPTGELQIYKRIKDSRLPIRRLYGPGHFQALKDDEKIPELQKMTEKRLEKNFRSEADYVLQQAGLK